MDKIGLKNYIITLFKIYFVMLLIFLPFTIVVYFFMGLSTGEWNPITIVFNIISIVLMFLFLVLVILLIGFLVYLYDHFIKRKHTVKSEGYYRDIPGEYSPAIVSALLDLNVEISTDYPATVSYLCVKKYIKMNEDDDGNLYFTILNSDTSKLNEHEQYVFDCLFKGKTFDNISFREKIKNDAIKLGLLAEGKRKIHFFRNFSIALAFFFIMGIISSNIEPVGFLGNIIYIISFISGLSIFGVIIGSIYLASKYQNENYYRTHKGNQDSKKWVEFKNYLRDYTLIEEKDLSYSEILELYIPYAISLGETFIIEKFIATNKIYRNLLYREDYDFKF